MTGAFPDERVGAFLERAVDLAGDAIASPPFPDLAERWRALGLRAGDLVLLSLPTGKALLQHFFGVIAAGGVPALIAPGMPSARLSEMAGIMGARAIAAVRLPNANIRAERTSAFGGVEVAWLAAGPPACEPGEAVLLTSGTSGSASGCVFDVAALLRNGARHADSIGQREADTVLVSLPLHFSFALVAQALGTLGRGGKLVIGGPPFNPDAYRAAIAAHGVTVSALTPIQVRTLLHHGHALPASLRVLGVGGDSLAPEHVGELIRLRPDGELYLTYGLTQAGPRVSTLAAHAEPTSRHASVGRPIGGTRVSLEDLGDGSGRRELCVSSDTLMRRRIGLVEGRSGEDFRAPGVLATGDVFDADADGYLFYRARLSQYILRGGEKVCLATVRRVATQLPGVVGARTRVSPRDDGEDFDLTLVVAEDRQQEPEHYRGLLGRALRRAEMPRSIDVVVDHPTRSLGYK